MRSTSRFEKYRLACMCSPRRPPSLQRAISDANAANKAALEAAAAKEAADKEVAEKLLYEPNYTVGRLPPDDDLRHHPMIAPVITR